MAWQSAAAGLQKKKQGERIKVFKGHEIVKHIHGVSVDGQVFANVLEAEKFIAENSRLR